MSIQPLREGRESIADQAARRGSDVPVGSTVEELLSMGYDVDPDWPLCAVIEASSDSPTGYCVKFPTVIAYMSFNDGYALAY